MVSAWAFGVLEFSGLGGGICSFCFSGFLVCFCVLQQASVVCDEGLVGYVLDLTRVSI